MDARRARERFRGERVARLATVSGDGEPHLVPVTFAVTGDRIMIAIDRKPKTTTNLRRLRNIRAHPRVTLLADHYEDDWARLWWVRADGSARVVESGTAWASAIDALAEKYDQYRTGRPDGPVILVEVFRWSGWSSSE
ncbi:TIGR03668 family PPOX class F420-dependent oxidoreductase [Nonomuraea cavernae]|uniref:PPOX class F420-dependent oxidoreductase n=1 Tax=Nonomuraea cavernae TaxID=2045107 RepID=A0A917YZ89_9ACTN|nr:TIGR03668 family PPOX class F420-dependent oxidoreductase [Nonomuraea cavernae]MCA2187488.1 TIGR03668 family PPOX class F420-dependent oxidoreductase [Nonomuraea cavernae]GGO68771.1 PPOX class F420-dependent oxidoreductase [Nonomuraea cavernae]